MEAVAAKTSPPAKNPSLQIAIALGATGVIAWLAVRTRWIDLQDPTLAWLSHASMLLWTIVLLWAVYHLMFQLLALARRLGYGRSGGDTPHSPATAEEPDALRYAVLYLTCDDFYEDACRSCLLQQFDSNRFRIYICDDSREAEWQRRVDGFAAQQDVIVVRRAERKHFKAGNLNHAITTQVDNQVDWIVIVDADEVLPPQFLETLDRAARTVPDHVAFFQGRNVSDHLWHYSWEAHEKSPVRPEPATAFQNVMGLEVEVLYNCELPLRQQYGFFPLMGHGAAVRREAVRATGGFPPLVFEDFGFAFRASQLGLRGQYLPELYSWEAFPRDFGAFLVRFQKFAAGGAEFIRRNGWAMATLRITSVETLDLAVILLWYPLLGLIFLNQYLSAYICYRLWDLDISPLHPSLAVFFVLMHMAVLPLRMFVLPDSLNISQVAILAVRYWFWSAAIYAAALPLAALQFWRRLLLGGARFHRTPKTAAASPRFVGTSVAMVLLGIGTLFLAIHWRSPFSPFLAAQGCAYLSFPLYIHLHQATALGTLARAIVWVPGALLIATLVLMYQWAFHW